MTLFDFLDRLAFLRGEVAALLLVATAVAIFILPDARLALLALAGQYFAAALLFVDVLDPRLAVVKLLTGWFVCLMLYLTGRQVNWGRPPADLTPAEAAQWPRPAIPGAGLAGWRLAARASLPAAALALLAIGGWWWVARRAPLALPILPETLAYFTPAVAALVGFGLLQMGRSARPLTAGFGAFLFLSGVELAYSLLDQSVVGLGLLAALNLTLALAVGYLAQAQYALPLPPPSGRRYGERVMAVIGLAALLLWGGWLLGRETAVMPIWPLLLASLGALYLLALVWPVARDLVPITLAAAGLLAAALLVETAAWGGPLLIMGLLLLALAGQSGQRGEVGASWRYLVLTLVALPLLLLAGWQAGLPAALPLSGAALLAGAALLLLGGFPAFLWVRPLARRAAPPLWPFLFGGAQLAIVAYLFRWLAAQPAWATEAAWVAWLTWGGVGAALLGGLLAALATAEEELLPSLLLLDLGVALLLLLRPDGAGWETAVLLYRGRLVGLLWAGVGWLLWREGVAGRKRPLGRLLWAYGGLTLIGLPLTAGFAARWALLAQVPPLAAGLLLLALLGGLWGLGRWLAAAGREDYD